MIRLTVAPGSERELLDCGRDQAHDPAYCAGADDGLGVGPVGYDALDGAGDLVAGREAGDRSAGKEDVVGADLDEQPRAARGLEERDDQLRAVVELKMGRALLRTEWLTIWPGKTLRTPVPGDRIT